MVLDTRIGLYNDPPNEEAMKLIQSVDDSFKCMQILVFGFVEKNLLPYMDTPSFKKFSKAFETAEEVVTMFINKKIEEMAKRDDFQENQGEWDKRLISIKITKTVRISLKIQIIPSSIIIHVYIDVFANEHDANVLYSRLNSKNSPNNIISSSFNNYL